MQVNRLEPQRNTGPVESTTQFDHCEFRFDGKVVQLEIEMCINVYASFKPDIAERKVNCRPVREIDE